MSETTDNVNAEMFVGSSKNFSLNLFMNNPFKTKSTNETKFNARNEIVRDPYFIFIFIFFVFICFFLFFFFLCFIF